MPFVVFRGVSQRPGHPRLFEQRTQHDFFMGIDPALQLLRLHAAHPLQVFRPGLQLRGLLPQCGFAGVHPFDCRRVGTIRLCGSWRGLSGHRCLPVWLTPRFQLHGLPQSGTLGWR